MIGSIFVITIVMGDFVTVGVMGGQQIASVGKIINTQMGALQFPPAAANSVILLVAVLVIIWALTGSSTSARSSDAAIAGPQASTGSRRCSRCSCCSSTGR